MKILPLAALLITSGAAWAQRSAVPSDSAGNILPGSPEIARSLPGAGASADTVAAYLNAAGSALDANHTGAAQSALENAETRQLDRSVAYGANHQAIDDPVIRAIYEARQALGRHDIAAARRAVMTAQAALGGG